MPITLLTLANAETVPSQVERAGRCGGAQVELEFIVSKEGVASRLGTELPAFCEDVRGFVLNDLA